MLREHQVRHLLEEAEKVMGPLTLLRKHLASRDPVPYIWEVVLIDTLLRSGASVSYEATTEAGLTPDLFVVTANSTGFWLEAAYVRDRFAEDQVRLDAMGRQLAREQTLRRIPIGTVGWRADGNSSPAGFRKTLPAEHDLTRFFKLPEIVEFFGAIRATPQRVAVCDLRGSGYTLVFTYNPKGAGGSGGLVSDVPQRAEEHSVFRALRYKGRKYSKIQTSDPIVIAVGSEDSHPASTWQSVHAVPLTDAVYQAFQRHPALSAAFVVSIESNNSMDHYGRVARARLFINDRSERPLSVAQIAILRRLNFDGVEYGGGWNEWSGRDTIADRRRALGGHLRVGGPSFAKGGTAIEIPTEVLLQMLAGAMTESDFIDEYRLAEMSLAPPLNPFRVVWEEGRQLLAVSLTSSDPRSREGSRVRFEFGPPQPMLLQVRRTKSETRL